MYFRASNSEHGALALHGTLLLVLGSDQVLVSKEHGLRKAACKVSSGGEDSVYSNSEKEAGSRGGAGALGERRCWNTVLKTSQKLGEVGGKQQKKILSLPKPSLN